MCPAPTFRSKAGFLTAFLCGHDLSFLPPDNMNGSRALRINASGSLRASFGGWLHVRTTFFAGVTNPQSGNLSRMTVCSISVPSKRSDPVVVVRMTKKIMHGKPSKSV
jgi:hypothetical protein